MPDQTYQLVVDGVPYIVKAAPFTFNDDTRYTVSYNGSPEFIFAWDAQVGQYVSIGDESESIPANVEIAIAGKLQPA